MATIHDVALRARVSAGTVSNVLNRPSYVNADTRKRVLDAILELDFSPRSYARQYRRGRGRTLGLALADMGNPFFVDVALGAEAAAKEAGVGVLIVHNGEDVDREEQNLDLLIQQRVHGIMITPVDERNPRLEEIVQRGVPVVYVDRISGDRPCCWLATDDVEGGRLAGQHLVGLGHRKLGFVGAESISRQVRDRLVGFRRGVAEGGIDPASIVKFPAASWRIDDGQRIGAQLAELDEPDRPSAVFCANDLLAIGVLQAATHGGLRLPDDLAIVGFDDLEWAAATALPLTTIRQPREQLGRDAVRMILSEVEEGPDHDHQHVVFAPELVIRESSSPRFEMTDGPSLR